MTLEELKQQYKQLRKEIREMQKQACVYGKAKIAEKPFANKKSEWYLALFVEAEERQERWVSIIRSENRDEVIDSIDNIIKDLRGLKAKIKKFDDAKEGESNGKR